MDQRLLNDVLECSVCLEQLDDTSRVLPCQHTFCLRCLQDIVQSHKELRCPECRVLVTVALENLPTNILLMRILEGLRNTTRCSLGSPGAVSSSIPCSPLPSPLIPKGREILDGPPLTQAPPLPPNNSQTASSASDSGSILERSLGLSSCDNRNTNSSNSNPFMNIVGSIFMEQGCGSILSSLSGETQGLSGQNIGNSNTLGELGVGITRSSNSLDITTTVGSSLGVSSISSNNHPSLSATTYNRHHTISGQPYAKALFNYDRKEPRDLSFKKGDIVILRKKIDSNWYQGELNGNTGFFPASYVQVIVPLPNHIPQCKALYDFKMTNDEERDCLTFNKGEVITVLRRVDENWAEGKLGMRIGIFPLSFVDLNSAAKALMKLSLNASAGPSLIAPPTPTDLEDSSNLFILADNGPPTSQAPPLPTHTDVTSSSSSVVTSPDPSLTSPTSSPSSPPHHTSQIPPTPLAGATTPLMRGPTSRPHREKRHSFTAVRTYNPSSPSRSPTASPYRHSLEILSPGEDKSAFIGPVGLGAGGLGTSLTNNKNMTNNQDHGSGVDSSTSHVKNSSIDFLNRSSDGLQSSTPQVNVTTFFVALYTYRGRKSDELDLHKSYLYTVNEKCQDGWYKGRCITTDKAGVFPGNYVQVAKPQMIAAYLAKRNGRQSSHHNRSNSSNGSCNILFLKILQFSVKSMFIFC